MKKRMRKSFMKMSTSFPDPVKAEECFHRLDQLKDNDLFNKLEELLDEVTIEDGHTRRVSCSLPKFVYFHSERCTVLFFCIQLHASSEYLSFEPFCNKL